MILVHLLNGEFISPSCRTLVVRPDCRTEHATMASLVFDIGGTKTRAGLFDPRSGALAQAFWAPTPNHLDLPLATFEELYRSLISLLCRLGDKLVARDEVDDLGVAFAGPIDPSGSVLAAPTVWGTRLRSPIALSRELERHWPRARVRILNDVTAAGFRHLRPGGEDFCIVTVSSGIGNKVFAGGRPLLGKSGRGGELGHLRVDESASAPICECGGRGHLGAIASGRGALGYARTHAKVRNGDRLTSGDLAAAFGQGEEWAVDIVRHCAAPLGWGLAAMHLGLGIERFVLFGGFALALGEPYRQLVSRAATARCWDGRGSFTVELGIDDDWSGLIGAGIAGGRQ
jgi:predicted NBD/HSP70 family sugar kinase